MLDVALRKRLGNFVLDAAFAAPAGGVTALFGSSGSGKSTIVNAIAGLLRPDAGHIRVGETSFFDAEAGIDQLPRRRRVGYVFQEARLFPHMRVRDNLLYGYRRAPNTDRRIGFEAVVELLGIEAFLARRPFTLSGGERQRVALGRALLAQPRLLLMDEPMAALDVGRKAEILPYIERLRDELRLPIVYVSHSVEEVARLADTLVVLEQGRVAAAGDVASVMAQLDLFPPDSPYEAGAVVPVEVAAHDASFGLTTLAFAGGKVVVPRVERALGAPLRIRIRARDVMLALARPVDLSAINVLPAVVGDMRQAGCHADVQIAIGATRLVARITRQSAIRLALSPGKPVFAVIKSVAIDGGALAALSSGNSPIDRPLRNR
jgi:molybdate transport system ATP-binding protein